MKTKDLVNKLVRNGFKVDWNYENPDTFTISYDENKYNAEFRCEVDKTVSLKIPYDDLTVIIECMEDLFKNSNSEKEKEKIRRMLCPLIDFWGRNAKKETGSDLYFQEEVDKEQEIEDEEKSYEADN